MDEFVPQNYTLKFEPNLDSFTFKGNEIIEFTSTKSTNKIKLNVIDLHVQKCFVKINDKIIQSNKLCHNDEKRELEISLKEKIKGKCFLHMEFSGILNNKMVGFYRSQYKQDGTTKFLATTQFQERDACRAFPCWDHPNAKATFDITITTNSKFTAISNMPVKEKKDMMRKRLTHFLKHLKCLPILFIWGLETMVSKVKKSITELLK